MGGTGLAGAGRRVAAVLVAVACLAGAANALAAGPVAHASRVGAAPAATPLNLVFPLVADDAGLQRFAREVATPSSERYGHYESIAMLAQRFGASARTRQLVSTYLRRVGASHVKIDATGLFADATMPAGLAERLFVTPLAQFRTAAGARFIAPTASVELPAALRGLVTSVVGLDTEPLTRQASIAKATPAQRLAARARLRFEPAARAHAADQPSSELVRTGTPSGCAAGRSAGEQGIDPATAAFTPNQYLTAYGLAPMQAGGLRGQGERVALVEIDGFDYNDIKTYARCFGLGIPAIFGFGVGLAQPLPPGGEATLDLEVLDAAAPRLKAIDVYESKADAADALRALTAPIQNGAKNMPQVISASLGLCEPVVQEAVGDRGIRATEDAFAMVAAAGTTFLASSGDQGSADCNDNQGNPAPVLAVNYPASSPWVTGVGGTNIALDAHNNLAAQVVWNDTSDQPGSAGGGGLSGLFGRPSYQNGFVSKNHRVVPDVALLADLVPGYAIFCTASGLCQSSGSAWQSIGGTSAATPLLAGGVALVDQASRVRKRQAVGFLNPLLYSIAAGSLRSAVFSDVTQYGNDIGPYVPSIGTALGCCDAGPGFDAASGFGSVNVSGLAQAAIRVEPPIETISISGSQRPIHSGRLLVTVSCSFGCRMGAIGEVQIGSTRFLVRSPAYNLRHGGRKTIPLSFTRKQQRTLRSALRHHKRVLMVVEGVLLNSHNHVLRQTLVTSLVLRR